MEQLKSYLSGAWVYGSGKERTLHNATTGEAIATVSTEGVDLGAAVRYGRTVGGPALRAMSFAERGALLKKLAEVIHAHRDDLIDLSRTNGGTNRSDAKFDIDGASGTLSYYGYLGEKLGDAKVLRDGDPERILRSKRFIGQHVLVPRRGVAVHINAFNFPAWGMAEKLAVSLLAGVPAITKPGTATAWLAVRIVELWVESGLVPEGAIQLVSGSAGDLLDHLGPQDCVAFTGGSETGRTIRGHENLVRHNIPVNIEADSLNASVLGPDVDADSDTFLMFINQLVVDMSQKAGQKCTAVRRVFVPMDKVDDVVDALTDRLDGLGVGDPSEKSTRIGPVSSGSQQRSVNDGVAQLEAHCEQVWAGKAPEGDGYFVRPRLFRSDKGIDTPFVHEHEVFGPVATILPWDGSASGVVAQVAAGGGGLVCSVYSDDVDWAGEVVLELAPFHGRIHWGSRKVHDQSPGPGTVLPNLVHGGPGKAGGGSELGGMRGLHFYMQRTAIQADKGLLDRILG